MKLDLKSKKINEEDYLPKMLSLADYLVQKYGFSAPSGPLVGLEVCYVELFKNDIHITIGWDIWSGVFVMAHCHKGDFIIQSLWKSYTK